MDSFSTTTVAERTRLTQPEMCRRLQVPLRTLRYVLDHRVVPGIDVRKGPTSFWRFSDRQLFLTGVAAHLYHTGIGIKLLREIVAKLAQPDMAGAFTAEFRGGPARIQLWLDDYRRCLGLAAPPPAAVGCAISACEPQSSPVQ